MARTLESNYAKVDLKQIVDNASHLNVDESTLSLILLEDFDHLFDGTLGNWATEFVNLELNPNPKPFNSRYYPPPIIDKDIFRKELKRLVELDVLTPLQKYQYGTPVFIISKK